MGAALRTPGQNRQLWGLVNTLARASGCERDQAEEALRRHCREVSGQEHSSMLSVEQAAEVTRRLGHEIDSIQKDQRSAAPTDRQPWGPRGPGPRHGQMATLRQHKVLEALYRQAGWDCPAQIAFSTRQCKKPWPQSQQDADAILEALKAIVLRKVKPAAARARAIALQGRPELDAWKRNFVADLVRQFEEAAEHGHQGRVMTTHKLLKLTECELACGIEVGP